MLFVNFSCEFWFFMYPQYISTKLCHSCAILSNKSHIFILSSEFYLVVCVNFFLQNKVSQHLHTFSSSCEHVQRLNLHRTSSVKQLKMMWELFSNCNFIPSLLCNFTHYTYECGKRVKICILVFNIISELLASVFLKTFCL